MLRTRLTEALQIEHPVMLAGMGGVSYSRLAAAVSAAGGFGCLGASTMSDDQMRVEIAAVRGATDRPFGVDLLTALPRGLEAKVDDIIRGGATAFVAGLGVPRDVVDQCHEAGLVVVNMCGKVRHAVDAVEAGCDIVVAQGTEAGGHTGRVATMALVPQVADAVGDRVPVVAAGGIVDGRGLAAALALGADGVWVGTRFIATPEARGVIGYKDVLLRSHEDDTTVTRAYTGKTCRVIANSYTRAYEDGERQVERVPRPGPAVDGGGRQPPRRRRDDRGRRHRPRVLPRRPGRGRHREPGAGGRAGGALRRRGRGGPRQAAPVGRLPGPHS